MILQLMVVYGISDSTYANYMNTIEIELLDTDSITNKGGKILMEIAHQHNNNYELNIKTGFIKPVDIVIKTSIKLN